MPEFPELPSFEPPQTQGERWIDFETGDEYIYNGHGYWEGFNGLTVKYDPDRPELCATLIPEKERPGLQYYRMLQERAAAIDPDLVSKVDEWLIQWGCRFKCCYNVCGRCYICANKIPKLNGTAIHEVSKLLEIEEKKARGESTEPKKKRNRQQVEVPQPIPQFELSLYQQAWMLSDASGIPRSEFNEICRRIRQHDYLVTKEEQKLLFAEIDALAMSRLVAKGEDNTMSLTETPPAANETNDTYESIVTYGEDNGFTRDLVLAIYTRIAQTQSKNVDEALSKLFEAVEYIINNPMEAFTYAWENFGIELPDVLNGHICGDSPTENVDEDGEVVDILVALSERMSREDFLKYLRQEGLLPGRVVGAGKFDPNKFEVKDESSFNWFTGLIADLHTKQDRIQNQADAMKNEIDTVIKGLKFHFGSGAKVYAISQLPRDKNGKIKKKSFITLHGTFSFRKTGGWQKDQSKEGKAEFEKWLHSLTPKEMEDLKITTEEVVVYDYDTELIAAKVKAGEIKPAGYVKKGEEDEYGSWDIKAEKSRKEAESTSEAA